MVTLGKRTSKRVTGAEPRGWCGCICICPDSLKQHFVTGAPGSLAAALISPMPGV